MKVYGQDLSGRDFGKQTFKEISEKYGFPISLDFAEVGSIGSSFADELVAEVAKMQSNKITIYSANRVIRSCLNDVATEKKFSIEYQ
jgi:anti-anti-sigma regulatory factor